MKKIIAIIISSFCSLTLLSQTPNFNTQYLSNGAYHFNDHLKVTRDNIFSTYKSQFG